MTPPQSSPTANASSPSLSDEAPLLALLSRDVGSLTDVELSAHISELRRIHASSPTLIAATQPTKTARRSTATTIKAKVDELFADL